MKRFRIDNDFGYKLIVSGTLSAALGITLYRGFELPRGWAVGHWLTGYDFGFTKRGLIGALFKPIVAPVVGSPDAGARIDFLTTTFLLGLCAAVFWVTVRMMKRTAFSAESVLTAALFFTSPYFVMSGHLNGFFDSILALLTLLSIYFAHNQRFLPAAVVLSIGMLVHETILIVGMPSVLFAAWLRLERTPLGDSEPVLSFGQRVVRMTPFFIPLSLFVFLWAYQQYAMDAGSLRRSLLEYYLKFDCIDRAHAEAVAGAYTAPYTRFMKYQSAIAFESLTEPVHLLQILPSFLLMLLFVRRSMSVRFSPLFLGLAALINLCPFALFFIATDTSRVWTYPLLVAMYTVWTVERYAPRDPSTPSPRSLFWEALSIVAITANLFSRVPLMVGRRDGFTDPERFLLYLPVLLMICWCIARFQEKSKQA